MQIQVIYYTITHEGAFYYDGKILPVLGYDLSTAHYKPPVLTDPKEIEHRLEELRPAPYFRRVKVANRETLERVAREIRAGERNIDAQPLMNVINITRQSTLKETAIYVETEEVYQLAGRYENAEICQSQLLSALMKKFEQAKHEGNHESATFLMLLCILVNHQLSCFTIKKREA
jgi:hypothetical protein